MKQRLMLLALPLLIACGGSDTDTASDAAKDTTTMAEATSTPTTEASTGGTKMYEVKSGMYEMKNSMMEGMMQTVYFDDYGAKQATYSTAELMGVKTENVQIMKDGWNISYDVQSKKGSKMKVPAVAGAGGSLVPKPSELTDELKEKYEYKELGTRTILGKESTGYSMNAMGMKVKAWAWNNIPLYMEMDMGQGGPIVMEVTKLETDIDVPADRFEVPADITLEEMKMNTGMSSTGN